MFIVTVFVDLQFMGLTWILWLQVAHEGAAELLAEAGLIGGSQSELWVPFQAHSGDCVGFRAAQTSS